MQIVGSDVHGKIDLLNGFAGLLVDTLDAQNAAFGCFDLDVADTLSGLNCHRHRFGHPTWRLIRSKVGKDLIRSSSNACEAEEAVRYVPVWFPRDGDGRCNRPQLHRSVRHRLTSVRL